MNFPRTAVCWFSSLWLFAAPIALADDMCLAGKWKVQEETFKASDALASRYDVELSASDGVTIEFRIDSSVHLVYDNYVIRHNMQRHHVTVFAEATVNGVAEGRFYVSNDRATLSISAGDKVRVETKQKAASNPWMSLGEKERKPMHSEEGLAFSCSGDELILTKIEHGYFNAEYRGRFVRAN